LRSICRVDIRSNLLADERAKLFEIQTSQVVRDNAYAAPHHAAAARDETKSVQGEKVAASTSEK
jgi:hypothetical protein